MPYISEHVLVATLFFTVLAIAILKGCGVSAKFFGFELKAEPKSESRPKLIPKRRRRKKPKRLRPQPPNEP